MVMVRKRLRIFQQRQRRQLEVSETFRIRRLLFLGNDGTVDGRRAVCQVRQPGRQSPDRDAEWESAVLPASPAWPIPGAGMPGARLLESAVWGRQWSTHCAR